MEDGNYQPQQNGNGALLLPVENLDRRVLDKITLALESRLTEHISGVERRLAEMDAETALELQALEKQSAARDGLLGKAVQEAREQWREQLQAARNQNAERISGVDQRLSALQEALAAKFREIVEAVRQAMEARLSLEVKELENRVASRGVAPEQILELESKMSSRMQAAKESYESQFSPLRQTLEQLESQLGILREELPPRIREIVEAVESAMKSRITAGHQGVLDQAATIRQGLEEDLKRQAAAVEALDRKLAAFQQELPLKFKAIVDAVQESLEARMAAEREAELERSRQYSSALDARIEALERNLQRNTEEAVEHAAERVWHAIESRLQQHAAAPPAPRDAGSINELRLKSTSAEQNVLDLIAGLGALFERPVRPTAETAAESSTGAQQASEQVEPEALQPPEKQAAEDEDVPILFKPTQPSRKWRIPFVSSLFLI
jgi:archaellum component FlaC